MQSKITRISPEGILVLPDELREFLKNTPELVISWNENFIVMKPISRDKPEQPISMPDKIVRLFDIADDLANLNKIAPLSENEIQGEIEACRSQK